MFVTDKFKATRSARANQALSLRDFIGVAEPLVLFHNEKSSERYRLRSGFSRHSSVSSVSGKESQRAHTVIHVGRRGAGWRRKNSEAPLNPCEKTTRQNGWLIMGWTSPGFITMNFITTLGDNVLSVCAGSGSLLAAAMDLGRSCIAFEANGNNYNASHSLVRCDVGRRI